MNNVMSKHLPALIHQQKGLCACCNRPLERDDDNIDGELGPVIGYKILPCQGGNSHYANLRAEHRICNTRRTAEITAKMRQAESRGINAVAQAIRRHANVALKEFA